MNSLQYLLPRSKLHEHISSKEFGHTYQQSKFNNLKSKME